MNDLLELCIIHPLNHENHRRAITGSMISVSSSVAHSAPPPLSQVYASTLLLVAERSCTRLAPSFVADGCPLVQVRCWG